MALIESKEVKRRKREVAVRMGKRNVIRYVNDCNRMAEKYTDMAKRALSLGNTSQCDQYLCRKIQYDQQANKWDSFLLKMEDLSLRGQMSNAMTGLVTGMQALTKQIRAGVSSKTMNKAVTDLNVTMAQLDDAEDQLTSSMESLDYEVGNIDNQAFEADIPQSMKEEVERMRNEMMGEVVVNEKVGESFVGLRNSSMNNTIPIKNRQERLNKLKDLSK